MNESIFEAIFEILGEKFPVIKSFSAEEEVVPDGVLAVNITQIEPLLHGPFIDYKISVEVNGQTFSEQDQNRSKILEMFDYCLKVLKPEELKEKISNCAGVLLGENSTMASDGETNNFSIALTVFICS